MLNNDCMPLTKLNLTQLTQLSSGSIGIKVRRNGKIGRCDRENVIKCQEFNRKNKEKIYKKYNYTGGVG